VPGGSRGSSTVATSLILRNDTADKRTMTRSQGRLFRIRGKELKPIFHPVTQDLRILRESAVRVFEERWKVKWDVISYSLAGEDEGIANMLRVTLTCSHTGFMIVKLSH
jgi:hypothetical protein